MRDIHFLHNIIDLFQDKKVLVLGDIILDEYILGDVDRICPEAPVPVVLVSQRNFHLGGAANVVQNLRALGAKTSLCGVVGNDASSQVVFQLLNDIGCRSAVLKDDSRPTTKKTRVIAQRQQIVRFDHEKVSDLSPSLSSRLFQQFCDVLPESDIVIVSDYAKGLLSRHFFQEISIVVERAGKKLIVDPKRLDLNFYQGSSVLTPNLSEAKRFVQFQEELCSSIEKLGLYLLATVSKSCVINPLGGDGMAVFEREKKPQFIKTHTQEVFDVSGAGDTAISVLSLGLASGLSLSEAATLSNIGAGVVVGKVGTATVTPSELKKALNDALL